MKNPLSGVDTSKKHGTNNNFMKSGMKNADGSEAAGAPFLGGIVKRIRKNPLDPLGLFGGRKGGKGGACPTGPMGPPPARPAEPTGTPAPAEAPAAAAPAPAAEAEEAQPAATMKKDLMKGGAPKDKKYGPQTKQSTLDTMVSKSSKLADDSVDAYEKEGKSLKSEMLKHKGRKIRKSAKKIYKGGAPMTEDKKIKKKVRKDRIMDAKPPNWKETKKRTIMDPAEKVDPKYRIGGGVKPRNIKKGAPMTEDKKVRRPKEKGEKSKRLRDIRKEMLVGPVPSFISKPKKMVAKKLKKKGAPNYKNPQDYKVFNMGNKPTPVTKNKKY